MRMVIIEVYMIQQGSNDDTEKYMTLLKKSEYQKKFETYKHEKRLRNKGTVFVYLSCTHRYSSIILNVSLSYFFVFIYFSYLLYLDSLIM